MRRLFALVLIALTCTACLRSSTLITVKADGSGTIDQEIGASPQAMAMLRSFAAGEQGERKTAPPTEGIFGPAQAQKLATEMGVRYVSGEPVKTADMEGFRAKYAFDDIAKLRMKMNQNAAPSPGAGAPAEPPFGFDFERRGDASVLTIRMPEQKMGPNGPLGQLTQMPGSQGTSPADNQQAIAMMKMMMRGLFVDVSLAVDGRIVKTNAPFVSGSKITLAQMDFDTLLANESAFEKLQKASDAKQLKDVPGLKLVTDPKVTIEFVR